MGRHPPYGWGMRTTISLDEQLGESEPPPFRLITVRGSRPRPGVDLERPRTIDVEEDVERFGPSCHPRVDHGEHLRQQ